MHNVYIIPGETGEDQFRKEAYTRLAHGEGFTMFHHHRYKTLVDFFNPDDQIPLPISCSTACRVNDPYPGHNYQRAVDGVPRKPGPETCAVYQQLDPMFFASGGQPAKNHCLDCHCTCFEAENDDLGDTACTVHELSGCPGCAA